MPAKNGTAVFKQRPYLAFCIGNKLERLGALKGLAKKSLVGADV